MPLRTLSLFRVRLSAGTSYELPAGITAFLIHDGTAMLDGKVVTTGSATTGHLRTDDSATAILFNLSDGPPLDSALASEQIDVSFPCLLRLDEVAFPPSAQAYRHVHPGPGFRHLRWGGLKLEADDHSFSVTAGDTWFEPAHSPVKATASAQDAETRFVRCMILPPEYLGRATFQILDPADAGRPKLQTTHRHVDRILHDVHEDAG